MLFSFATIIPALFVFIFAVTFFNLGIETLFKSPIKDVIDNNNDVIDIHLQDMHLALKSYTNVLAPTINKCIDNNKIDVQTITEILNNESINNKIDIGVFQLYNNNINIISKSVFSLSIQYILPNKNILMIPMNNTISYEINDFIVTLQKLNDNLNIFLAVASPINQKIVNYRNKIKQASNQYITLINKHSGLKINFLMLFFIITTLLLLLAIFSGLVLANNILGPVNKLIIAVNNISSGNYKPTFEVNKINNEWDELLITFNNMVEQLEHQKQQLIIYNKQVAWRDLARKIAHEVKNPLTPILLSAERIKNKYRAEITTSPEVFNMCIDTIIRQVNCISCLIKEFSDFARMPAPVMEPNDLIHLLAEVIFMQSNSNTTIEFKSNFYNEQLICKFDATQINQVFINILQNAINSICESTNNSQSNYIGTILVTCYLENNMIYIIVEDTGPGFSETALTKAFEPYFTTRKTGNGLGLAIVYKIINDHGGNITISNSDTLHGAKITISIPYMF
ncbi:MAG: GHKL domain-containing protein [Alphaproteobacteria bacterium]|nr:GHKL domain-containing protein [Alphaproteobacteria bacterium]